MKVHLSENWKATDKSLFFVNNFTDVRAIFEVRDNFDDFTNLIFENDTIPAAIADYKTGQNIVLNNTDLHDPTRFEFILNGDKAEPYKNRSLEIKAIRCDGPCLGNIVAAPISDVQLMWSNKATWPNNRLPIEGDTIHIEPGWNVVLDIDTPILDKLIINGRLSFLNDTDLHVHVKHIFIRAGELVIG